MGNPLADHKVLSKEKETDKKQMLLSAFLLLFVMISCQPFFDMSVPA